MDKTKLIVHVGAHKTASTFVQQILQKNLKSLRANRIDYIPLPKIRSSNLTQLIRNASNPQETKKIIRQHTKQNSKRIILSEENLIGNAAEVFTKNSLYTGVHKPIKFLSKLYGSRNVTCLLVIRNYATFFPSLYCEFLRHRKKHLSFKNYLQGFNLESFSWINIIDQILAVADKSHLKVCLYEDFAKNKTPIFEHMIGENLEGFDLHLEKTPRSSYREKTIEIADVIATHYSPEDASVLTDSLNRKLIQLYPSEPKFSGFNLETYNLLNDKYHNEIEQLRARYKGLLL